MRGRIDHRFVYATVCLSERPLIRLAALGTFPPRGEGFSRGHGAKRFSGVSLHSYGDTIAQAGDVFRFAEPGVLLLPDFAEGGSAQV